MGKVGSKSFQTSLERLYGEKRVLHTHAHDEAKAFIDRWRRRYHKVIVITGFREPASRCISAYFENFTKRRNHWYVGPQEEVRRKGIAWLIDDYNAKVIPHLRERVRPWLENYQKTTQCDLGDFRTTGGGLKASLGNVHLYLYKLESLSLFCQGLEGDPHLGKLNFSDANLGHEKWYRDLYRDFKRNYRLSRDEYDEIYGNLDYVDFLYGRDEIRDLTRRFVLEPAS